MLNRIINALRQLSVNNYIIEERRRESAELFFIKKDLDMRRIKDVTDFSLTVFRDFTENGKEMRGAMTVVISPDTSDKELEIKLKEAYEASLNVKNPKFELYSGKKEPVVKMPSKLSELSLSEGARLMSEALYAEDIRNDAHINSAELFLVNIFSHIVSSSGTDVSYEKRHCSGEFVVQCKTPADVEQYFDFDYEDLEIEALRQKVKNALNTVCDRANASKSVRSGTYDIILSEDKVKTILDFYLVRSSASFIYAGYSDWKSGTKVQGDDIKGEKLNIKVFPEAPFSSEGIPMSKRDLTDNGELCFLHGPTRFCRYLGIEPTGLYSGIELDNGSEDFEEMKKGCLYPVSFSDFQMDELSGHFGGEIRLAYLYTDHGVEIVTGGSINGSLLEKQDNLIFSKEKYSESSYRGPFAVKFRGVNVSGN